MALHAEEKPINVSSVFGVGDRVRILATVPTPFTGLQGIIQEAIPHPQKLSQLDAYIVLFNWGEKQKFWSVQLGLLQAKAA